MKKAPFRMNAPGHETMEELAEIALDKHRWKSSSSVDFITR